MNFIKTTSFELAVYQQGEEDSNKLALVLPGLFDTKDYAHMRSHVDYLSTLGFLSISFDPPGTWESPGDISNYTGSSYLQAINELIDYFGNIPTFTMGHSRGATMSIASAVTNSAIKAFAAIMPSHIKGDYLGRTNKEWQIKGYRLLKRDLPPGGGKEIKRAKLPYSFFEDQTTYDYTEPLRLCTKPKLFIYGTHDTGATPKRVKNIYNIAAEPKTLKGIDSDHDYRLKPYKIEEVNKSVESFLADSDIF